MSTPSSNIYLLTKGNALSSDQHHTFSFANATEQHNFFFENNTYIGFTNTQYIRVSDNEVKIPKPKEELDLYSYMCIETVQYVPEKLNRYWYAFILDKEYVSDRCTKITFEIDVLQTFLFDGSVEFGMANVERCHQVTDYVGDNRVAEPFSVPNYIYNDVQNQYFTAGCVIGIIEDTQIYAGIQTTPTTPQMYYNNRVSSASQFYGFNLSNSGHRSDLLSLLDSLKGKMETITDFYFCPWEMIAPSVTAGYQLENEVVVDIAAELNIPAKGTPASYGMIELYTPKNNKLFTYPYNVLAVNDTCGGEMILKFEEFEGGAADGSIECSWITSPIMTFIPYNYEGIIRNYRYGLSLKEFPQFSVAKNAYETYKVQHEQTAILRTAANGIAGAVTGGSTRASVVRAALVGGASAIAPEAIIAGAAVSFLTSYADMKANEIEAKNKPDTLVHDLGGATTAIANGHCGYKYSRLSINGYYARIIDDYFTQFGYAQNRLIDIDDWLQSDIRESYKYIKTTDIHVKGICTGIYKGKIEAIFNRGVTFWKSTKTISDYTVSNNPIGGKD